MKIIFFSFFMVSCFEASHLFCDTTRRLSGNAHLEQMLPVPTGSCAFMNGHHSPNEGSMAVNYNSNSNSNHHQPSQVPVQKSKKPGQ